MANKNETESDRERRQTIGKGLNIFFISVSDRFFGSFRLQLPCALPGQHGSSAETPQQILLAGMLWKHLCQKQLPTSLHGRQRLEQLPCRCLPNLPQERARVRSCWGCHRTLLSTRSQLVLNGWRNWSSSPLPRHPHLCSWVCKSRQVAQMFW